MMADCGKYSLGLFRLLLAQIWEVLLNVRLQDEWGPRLMRAR